MRNHIVGQVVESSVSLHLADADPLRARLMVFARFCVARIRREISGAEAWEVSYDLRDASTIAVVRARMGDEVLVGSDTHADPAIAIWNAMCRIEQRLREARHPLRRRLGPPIA